MAEPVTENNVVDFEDIVDNLQNSKELETCLDQVHRVFDIYGIGHGCLHTISKAYSPSQALWRVTPDTLTNACSNLIRLNKHPATRLSADHHFAFDLFDYRHLFKDEPEVEALFDAFEENGLQHAYGLPIHTANDGVYVFVLGRPGAPIEAVELLTLQAICSNALNRIEQFGTRPSSAEKASNLTEVERKILLLSAKGQSPDAIAKSLMLGEVTLQMMIEKVIAKMNAQNLPHAIVLALIDGEFDLADCTAD